MSKSKIIFICIAIAALIIAVISLKPLKKAVTDPVDLVTQARFPMGEITSETIYEQTVKIGGKNLSALFVLAATFERENTATLCIDLLNASSGEILEKWQFTSADIADNSYLELPLTEKTNDFRGEILKLRIYSNDGTKENSYTLWIDNENTYKDGALYINGNETEHDVVMAAAFMDSGLYIISLAISVFVCLCAAVALYIPLFRYGKIGNIKKYMLYFALSLKQNKKTLLFIAVLAIAAVLIALILESALSRYIYSGYFIWQRFLFILAILLSAIFIYFFQSKPERLFLGISLTIGCMMSVTLPISLVSWDEETHYLWALQQSSVYAAYYSEADMDIRSISLDDYLNKEQRKTEIDNINDSAGNIEKYVTKNYAELYSQIGHIPAGIGIFIGRLLNLPWTAVFILGKLCNAVTYSLVTYFAVKRIKYGKYVISVLALIPTSMFLASNYQYDSWVIAWLTLGFAYFLAELQEPDSPVKIKNIAVMLAAFIIGLGPKAIYFPLMFILFFIGKEKFGAAAHCKYYRYALTASIVLVFASFALPFLLDTGSMSDYRGGEDVSSSAQVRWIISNPAEYAGILGRFTLDYLKINVENSKNLLAFFAYLGRTDNNLIFMVIVITAVIFTDSNKQSDLINFRLKGIALLSSYVTVALIATALYVSFTPVGHDTINGVQPRYLLPFLCPLLLVLRSGDIHNRIKEGCYSRAVFSLSAFFALSAYWTLCISRYY